MKTLMQMRPEAVQVLERLRAAGEVHLPEGKDTLLAGVGGSERERAHLWSALIGACLVEEDDEAEEQTWVLAPAGAQFLTRDDWDDDALPFLAQTVENLHSRRALLHAGTVMVDRLREAILAGDATHEVSSIVPPAFAPAVDERVALRMHEAAVALMSRLSAGAPAGCVAEEIIAVHLIDTAHAQLELDAEEGLLDESEVEIAASGLQDLWDLFQDDDVMFMFDMSEPSDAALANHTDVYREAGIADQRIEAWFAPLWDLPTTGHLSERPDEAD